MNIELANSKLKDTVLYTYEHSMNQLSFPKKFHFISRYYLWTRDLEYKTKLISLSESYIGNQSLESRVKILREAIEDNKSQITKQTPLRIFYYYKYPELTSFNPALFRLYFAKKLFDIELDDVVRVLVDPNIIREYHMNLYDDDISIFYLSTAAINFLYLSRCMIKDWIDPFDILLSKLEYFSTLAINPYNIKLYIYLLTHIIINQSGFYTTEIPNKDRCCVLLDNLTYFINKFYEDISLDNKLEYLVCAQMSGYNSELKDKILEESKANLKNGYISDVKHTLHKNTLENSEHRNILYILTNTTRAIFD